MFLKSNIEQLPGDPPSHIIWRRFAWQPTEVNEGKRVWLAPYYELRKIDFPVRHVRERITAPKWTTYLVNSFGSKDEATDHYAEHYYIPKTLREERQAQNAQRVPRLLVPDENPIREILVGYDPR